MKTQFALFSQLLLDMVPAVIASTGANITDTPEALKLSGSDVWQASNLRALVAADIVASADESMTVTVRVRKTDRTGTTSTVAEKAIAFSTSSREQDFFYFDPTGIEFDDLVFIQTETTSLGAAATYQVFATIDLEVPFQVAA